MGLLLAVFIIWRLTRVYDLEPEQTLDLVFLIFIISLFGSRLVFILLHLEQFNEIEKIIFFNRYPGLSFWGGVMVGVLALKFLAKRLKLDFYLIADFAAVGLFAGLIFGSFGCLLGACQVGIPSSAFYSVDQVGIIGKRFPVQAAAAVVYLLTFYYLWKACLRFHFSGKIASLGLIFLGVINFLLGFLRDDTKLYFKFSEGQVFAAASLIIGLIAFYHLGKRSFFNDLRGFLKLITDNRSRGLTLSKIVSSWYNLRIKWSYYLSKITKKVARRLNVKPNPPQL